MMGSAGLAWGIAALFGIGAAALFARLRQLAVEVSEARLGSEKLEGELRATRDQLGRESGKLRRKSDELADLRKRHDKLRKRKDGEGGGGKQASVVTGATDRDLEEARQARDRARDQASALEAELASLRAARAEAEASAAAEPVVETVTAAEAEQLRAEVTKASEALEAAKRDASDAEHMVARLKKRLQAQETAYVSLRGELEAKKDRLSTQNEELERLRALKITWVDAGGEGETVSAAEPTQAAAAPIEADDEATEHPSES